jgi:hypothetical protein
VDTKEILLTLSTIALVTYGLALVVGGVWCIWQLVSGEE